MRQAAPVVVARNVGAGLREVFDRAARDLGSELDREQQPAADVLAAVGASLLAAPPARGAGSRLRRTPARGAYLHGPVGRGKTWLVEVLAEHLAADLPAGAVLRLHAYEAARRLHRAVAARVGTGTGLDGATTDLLGDARVLFLDELHAHDPGDAMLLSRLLRALPERGVVLLATSNYAPSGLLPDPRHHHLVLPLVAALETTCHVVAVDGAVDHRVVGHGGGRPHWCTGAWLSPGGAAQLVAAGLAPTDPSHRRQLVVGGRPLHVLAADPLDHDDESADPAVHLHFADLCEQPTSVGDLLELTDRYRTVVLVGVPAPAAAGVDPWRRLANLVDVCWDRDVRLVVLAAEGPSCVLDLPITDGDRMLSRVSLLRRT